MKSAVSKSSIFFLLSFFSVLLAVSLAPVARSADAGTQSVSGTVQSVSDTSLVLSHDSGGKAVETTFELRPDTQIEGKVEKGAKATVEYRVEEGKNIAVHVTVSASS